YHSLSCAHSSLYSRYILFFFLMIPRPPIFPLFPYTTLLRSAPATGRQRAARLLDLFELADKADQLVEGYSHGMRQKLALAGELRSEEHTSELQSLTNLVCRLLLEKKKKHITEPQHSPVSMLI